MEDTEPLQVIITADAEGFDGEQGIEQCKRKIMYIITPRADNENDHKQAQLRQSEQLNGTLREQDRDYRRPRPFDKSIRCANCNDTSHPNPTADCFKKTDGGKLDADFESSMAQVDGKNYPKHNQETRSAMAHGGRICHKTSPTTTGMESCRRYSPTRRCTAFICSTRRLQTAESSYAYASAQYPPPSHPVQQHPLPAMGISSPPPPPPSDMALRPPPPPGDIRPPPPDMVPPPPPSAPS
ncbi:splicing factor SF1 [Gracilaria domingensis]|nr:splicing factor SF1 [Gracilaria domingensis]